MLSNCNIIVKMNKLQLCILEKLRYCFIACTCFVFTILADIDFQFYILCAIKLTSIDFVVKNITAPQIPKRCKIQVLLMTQMEVFCAITRKIFKFLYLRLVTMLRLRNQ